MRFVRRFVPDDPFSRTVEESLQPRRQFAGAS